MTLIEALKSGRNYKRQGDKLWHTLENDYRFTKEDILADNWVVEEPTITITKSELIKAYVDTLKGVSNYTFNDRSVDIFANSQILQDFLKKLGL